MKLKFICLLAAFIGMHVAASPNRNCDGVRPGKQIAPAIVRPAAISESIADDSDLLPTQYFLNHI